MAGFLGLLGGFCEAEVSPLETRAIAKEAFIYGFPMVEGYKTLYAQAVDKGGSDFKASFNEIGNTARVFTAKDTAFVTPNSDTPYSFIWMDLRAEPLVLTLPAVGGDRYYSVQLIDLYTHNFAYLGKRATGSEAGVYMIAGPGWKGSKPSGVKEVITCETQIAYALYRTQLFGADDIENVKKIQSGYLVQPLSAFLGQSPPPPAAPIVWPKPEKGMTETPAVFRYLNFLLAFAPTHPSERYLFEGFARIGVGPGAAFDEAKMSPETRQALQDGIDDALKEFAEFKKEKIDKVKVGSADFFGTRAYLKNNYLHRFAGAKVGIYGNSGEEAIYGGYFIDAEGRPADASGNRYILHFDKGQLPPADAFWSLTMYDGKTQLLVDNPLNRYLINSTMVNSLQTDPDGGVTLYLQRESPGPDKESNWLPAPAGPFYAVLRIYMPKPEVINGGWKRPLLQKAE